MKKITFVLTFSILFCGTSKIHASENYDYIPYMGMGYNYTTTNALSSHLSHNSATFYIGSEYSDYFSTQVYISQSDSKKKEQINNKNSFKSYGLDINGYLPLDCFRRFYLVATAGIGEYVVKEKIINNKHFSHQGLGYRFGSGFKYKFDNNWQMRAIVRYISYDKLEKFDHSIDYSINMEYHF